MYTECRKNSFQNNRCPRKSVRQRKIRNGQDSVLKTWSKLKRNMEYREMDSKSWQTTANNRATWRSIKNLYLCRRTVLVALADWKIYIDYFATVI